MHAHCSPGLGKSIGDRADLANVTSDLASGCLKLTRGTANARLAVLCVELASRTCTTCRDRYRGVLSRNTCSASGCPRPTQCVSCGTCRALKTLLLPRVSLELTWIAIDTRERASNCTILSCATGHTRSRRIAVTIHRALGA